MFLFYVFVELRKFFITKNLIITYKLNTIQSFYYKESLRHNLDFCHNPREIAKEEENINININR